jgi:hypothetical protein
MIPIDRPVPNQSETYRDAWRTAVLVLATSI